MINNLLLAIRKLQRNSVFTLINVFGLCLGMTAFILITQYVSFEKSYNSFHHHLPELYRILNETSEGKFEPYTAPGFAPLAASQISGIDQYCRLAEGANLGTGIVSYENATRSTAFRENNFVYSDENFFSFFTFNVTAGDAKSLGKPNVVAISKTASKNYFGEESALGKVLTLNNQFGKTLYTVEAVFEDMVPYSDLRYDLVFSLQTLSNPANLNGNDTWARIDGTGSQWLFTYLRLKEGASAPAVASQYTQLIHTINPQELSSTHLQAVANMHLAASFSDPMPTFGSLRFVYLLTGIAILILVIAWFNYINLATASALKRAKEVGIRKVVGASKTQLIKQFLGESFLLNVIAFILSLVLVGALQIPYALLIGKNITMDILGHTDFWWNATLVVVSGFLISSVYTAFVLSSFQPSKVLKGIFTKSVNGVLIRKSLVVIQFSISLILIASTIILFQQWKYMENKDLGMNAGQLLVVRGAEANKDETFQQRSTSFEREIGNAAFVDRFSRSGNVPSDGFNFATSGITRLNPGEGEDEINYDILTIDDQYLLTYAIKLVAGANFTTEMCSKSWNEKEYVLLNERAAALMGFTSAQEAVGQNIKWGERTLQVRGVVNDYHHQSVQYAIGPIVFLPSVQNNYYTLRIVPGNITANISALEEFYKKSFPGNPFEYQFLDDTFAAKYEAERQYSIIFTLASSLAILIGCLGLFGLATFTIEQRTKEIGVRKVLGSSVLQIINLLSQDFIRLVIMAFIIAVPLSWWLMEQWLQGFTYRITIMWWVFAVAGVLTGLVAGITVSVQAYRGATQNPVNSLRME